MRKEIHVTDKDRGIRQVTTTDERFYARTEDNPITGLPVVVWRPSVTWICDSYPKGKGFEMWLKKNGWDSDELVRLAGDRGYKVHRALAVLNEGLPVNIDDAFENQSRTKEELSSEEYAAIMSYVEWWESEGFDKYEILAWEYTIWPDARACSELYSLNEEYFLFAGMVDLKVRRKSDGKIGVVDFKTSLDIWPSHEMQVSAYKRADGAEWAAILQLNYRRNKTKKWKFTEVDDCFDLFIATRKIWEREQRDVKPLQREFPLSLQLKGREYKPPCEAK